MRTKTTSERFMPLVINLAALAATAIPLAACFTLSEKYEKKDKKFLSRLFGGLGYISIPLSAMATAALPFTIGEATQKYSYTLEEIDSEIHLLSKEEKLKYLEKIKERKS